MSLGEDEGSVTELAKVRPLAVLIIRKKHCKNQSNAKFFKKYLIFLSVGIKNDHKSDNRLKIFCFEKFPLLVQQKKKIFKNGTLEKKSGHPAL
jgi:hypothetical protein